MSLNQYKNILGYENIPDFLKKYISVPSLTRLKNVGYFCGMDYASKDIYDFKEYVSRYDHSLNVALITNKLTDDKKIVLAGLFHDVATPCFSHVIDYMNNDYLTQESTEEYTEKVLKSDSSLMKYLKEDRINIDDIINFKEYSIVDNDRPKLCADRLDGVILPGMFWTKDLSISEVPIIIDSIRVYKNEDLEDEIGFNDSDIAKRVVEVSNNIDLYCHSNEDNYMMELLSSITKYSIDKDYFSYDDLYKYNEPQLFNLMLKQDDVELLELLNKFMLIKKEEIKKVRLPKIKTRCLKPLVNGKRYR